MFSLYFISILDTLTTMIGITIFITLAIAIILSFIILDKESNYTISTVTKRKLVIWKRMRKRTIIIFVLSTIIYTLLPTKEFAVKAWSKDNDKVVRIDVDETLKRMYQ